MSSKLKGKLTIKELTTLEDSNETSDDMGYDDSVDDEYYSQDTLSEKEPVKEKKATPEIP